MSDAWYAAVKYLDGKSENVPISCIKKFEPKNIHDYNKNKKYVVCTANWSDDGSVEKYKGYIVRLGESLTELKESLKRKRTCCPKLNVMESTSDGSNSSTHDEFNGDPIQTAKKLKVVTREKKGDAANAAMAKFVQQYNATHAEQPKQASEGEENSASIANALKEKVTLLEQQLRRQNMDDLIIQKLEALEENMKRIDGNMKRMEKTWSEQFPRGTGSGAESAAKSNCSLQDSGRSSLTVHDKIDLGQNICIPAVSWAAMEGATQANDWATSLLYGVFGEEAKLYRLLPRKPENRRFPAKFLNVAKVHYRNLLLKVGYKEPHLSNRMKQMGAFLSDRATDMMGHRGVRGFESANLKQELQDPENTYQLNEATGNLEAVSDVLINPYTGELENVVL